MTGVSVLPQFHTAVTWVPQSDVYCTAFYLVT